MKNVNNLPIKTTEGASEGAGEALSRATDVACKRSNAHFFLYSMFSKNTIKNKY